MLVAFSFLIRRRMEESPQFASLKSQGTTSKNPLVDSFVKPENRRKVLIALFGATMGQGVVWYTGQFYALYFLQTVMNVEGPSANKIIAWGLVFGTPFFVVFGALSDRIGRKKLIMSGLLLATLFYLPIYSTMKSVGTPTGPFSQVSTKIESSTDPLTKTVKRFRNQDRNERRRRDPQDENFTCSSQSRSGTRETQGRHHADCVDVLAPSSVLVWLQVLFVTLVYGPIAAFLVELFPTKIRYTYDVPAVSHWQRSLRRPSPIHRHRRSGGYR